MKKITLAATLLAPSLAFAQTGPISVTVTDYGSFSGNAQAMSELDTMFNNLETEMNSKIPNFDLTRFTAGSAKSTVSASSGVGTDYASDFDFGLLSLNITASSDIKMSEISDFAKGDVQLNDLPGFSAIMAVTVGLSGKNLPALPIPLIDTTRARGYLHFMSASKKITPDSGIGGEASFTTFGAHGQYRLIEGGAAGLGTAKWLCLELGGGLKYTKMKVLAQAPVPSATSTQTVSGQSVTTTAVGTINAGAQANVFSIPVEVSTAARLPYFLNLFAGTGLDFNFGNAKSIANFDGDIAVTSNGPISGVKADAVASLDRTAGPGVANLKYFAGLQLEILALAVSVQYTGSLVNSTKGVNVGVKAFW